MTLARFTLLSFATLLLACGDDSVGFPNGPERGADTSTGIDDSGRPTRPGSDAGNADSGEIPNPDGGTDTSADTASDTAADAPADTAADTVGDAPPADVDRPDTRPDPSTAGGLAGTVWAPGNAPGMVPVDQQIPVSGALVYLSETQARPIPQRAYCAACETPPSRAVFSGNDGSFLLEGYTPGEYWLTIEKGQFRVEQRIEIIESTLTPVPADRTTLPSRNAPAEGLTTPRIAIASGSYDHLEDIFGKMAMGSVNGSGEYIPESADGVIDVFSNGGGLDGVAVGSFGELVRDHDRLQDYHVIFVPCSGDGNTNALDDQTVLRNLRDYVAAGGNLYVTDWSGEWADNVFPAQLRLRDGLGGFLGGGIDTPASAYDAARNSWNTSEFGSADGDSYDSNNAEAVDPDLFAWLNGQFGPTAHSDTPSRFDASRFDVEGNWNAIEEVVSVEVGVDGRGLPIVDEPHVWVSGGSTLAPNPKLPLTVSFEPAGCGRVVYSTYHTTDDRHVGLAPQERVLLYLIMEIGTCRDPKR